MSQPADSDAPAPGEPFFLSATAMREAHNILLQRRRDLGGGTDAQVLASFARDTWAFVSLGCRTGAILDDEGERMGAQSMLVFWANVLQRLDYEIEESELDDFDPSLAPDLPDRLCPYLGLDTFRESDRRRFFGRAQLTEQLVQRLASERALMLVGPSGSGKSSLARAGLLPALRDGALPGSADWRYLPPIVPGGDPLTALARALFPGQRHAQILDVVHRLRTDPGSTPGLLGAAADPSAVLLIDQAEELFTLAQREPERVAFVRAILALAGCAAPAHRVLLTMRSDFESFALAMPELRPLAEAARAAVMPLSPAELREAIEAPAAEVGLKFAGGVVDLLVQELVGEPAGLPLLQFTLLKLWEQREHNRISLATYERVGGGRLALARSADAFYERLIPEEQMSSRRILLRMVRPGDGIEVTSSRVRLDELYSSGEDPGRIERVIQKLVAARLVRLTADEDGRSAQVEVSHEALVRNWPRLVGWLEDEKQSLATRRRMEQRAQEWRRLGSGKAGLLDEAQLREAERWVGSPEAAYLGYDPALAGLIAASSEALREAEAAREAARQRELEQARALAEEQRARAEAETLRANVERRSRNILGVLAVILGVVLVAVSWLGYQAQASAEREAGLKDTAERAAETNASLAATAEAQIELERQLRQTAVVAEQAALESAIHANEQRVVAETQRNLALAVQLAAQARGALAAMPQRGLLLAVAAVQVSSPPAPIASEALSDALASTDGVDIGVAPGAVVAAAATTDGALLASADDSGALTLWGPAADPGAALLASVGDLGEPARLVALTDDGRWALIAGATRARLYPIEAGASIGAPQELADLPENISAVGIGPALRDGTHWLVIGGGDGSIRGWRLGDTLGAATSIVVGEQPTGQIRTLAFSPDGRWLASGGADRVARLWDLSVMSASSRLKARMNPRGGAITALAFSANSRWLAIGAGDGTINLWQLGGSGLIGNRPHAKTGPIGMITALAFSPDGAWLLSGSSDRNARLWSFDNFASDGAEAVVLTGHSGEITALTFSPDSQWAITGSGDRDILVWSINQLSGDPYRLHGHEQAVTALFALGDRLLSLGMDGQLRRWPLPPQPPEARASAVSGMSIDEKVELACLTAGRGLSSEERRVYFGEYAPSELPCQ